MVKSLTLAVADYDRVRPIVNGTVRSDRFDIAPEALAPSEIFYRLLTEQAFDIAEMSLSSYLIARQGGWEYTAIPVFPNRRLFHLGLWTTSDGPDAHHLAGTRIGLTEYQVTAAVWTRGILAEDFGLDLHRVSWRVERTRQLSHGGETGFVTPPGIDLLPLDPGDTLEEALKRGALDVILPSPYPGMESRLNRTDESDLEASPSFRPLFADALAETRRYLSVRSFLPMNHTVVVRNSLIDAHPWLPREIFRLFEEAKHTARESLAALRRSHLVLSSTYLLQERELFGADPYPYGLASNVQALETVARYSEEQGLIESRPDVRSLFESSLLET